MSVDLLERAEDVVARWRFDATDNPAGPLFTSGEYAEAEIIVMTTIGTARCSSCTASTTGQCC